MEVRVNTNVVYTYYDKPAAGSSAFFVDPAGSAFSRQCPLLLKIIVPMLMVISAFSGGARAQSADSGAVNDVRDGSKLTLDKAVAYAVKNNPGLRAMEYDVHASAARKDRMRSALFPRVKAYGGYAHFLDEQRLVQPRFNGEQSVFGYDIIYGEVVLFMPLFAGGRLLNEVRASDFLRQSAQHRLARTADELMFNVSSVYYGILAQERLIGSLQFSKSALESHCRRINDLIEAEKAAKVDLLRTEVRLSDVSQKLLREQNTLSIQYRLLANLMGLEDDVSSFVLSGSLEKTVRDIEQEEELTLRALEVRKDYKALLLELDAQTRRADAARAGYLPSLHLFCAYGGRWAPAPAYRPSGAVTAEDAGRIGLEAEIPLFEGGRVKASVGEEHAKLSALQEMARNKKMQIRLEVQTARSNILSGCERVETTEKAIEQARESLRIEREKYELGKGAILDVLDAQAALLDVETNYYRALADLNVARLQLNFATGKDYQ